MVPTMSLTTVVRPRSRLAWQGLRSWGSRQVAVAIVASAAVVVLLGVPTVLIPNQFFDREIPPTWWSYPVWTLTSVLSGMLVATYVRTGSAPTGPAEAADQDLGDERTNRLGVAGTVLAWFAVGCPACNKFALLALGYGGAMTWFAPVQPFLALAALAATGLALMARLSGQIACPLPAPARVAVS